MEMENSRNFSRKPTHTKKQKQGGQQEIRGERKNGDNTIQTQAIRSVTIALLYL